MKNKILLATSYEEAESILKWCAKRNIPTATVEAEYGEFCAKGTYATLAHHTSEYKDCPAPCVRDEVGEMNNGVIVISHIDLDTLGGIMILEGKKTDHPTFWNSEAIVDTKGYFGIKEISKSDETVMKAFLGIEKTMSPQREKAEFDFEHNIYDVTKEVLELSNTLNYLLNCEEDSNLIKYGTLQFEKYLARLKGKPIYQDLSVRIFKTEQPQHYLMHQEGELEFNTFITLNTVTGAIIISDISQELDCCKVMQNVFGEKAGGQFRVAGTPRDKQHNMKDVIKLCEYLNQHHDFSIETKQMIFMD